MTAPELIFETDGPVAIVTLNRPEKLNVLNMSLRNQLLDAWDRIERDDTIRVAILTAAGDTSFCVGRDLGEATSGRGHGFLPFPMDDHAVSKPVIAAVNGMALGGGCFLALACDLCIAAEDATFGLTEARVGRAPIYAYWLNRMIPQKVALELAMTGCRIGAARAHDLGLVNHVVPAAALMDRAREMAAEICAAAPLSVEATKAMIYQTAGMEEDEALARALALFEPVFDSEDALEGLNAFREKRAPVWRRR